ncbi:hypothetical protein [Leifsonia sp. NPDC080035]|uniref:Uncharacterized protein n=1 Tax=Leifsonia sp. NPDC080035 TaxID=3143936 RepID=A0AAU7G704_9MICO
MKSLKIRAGVLVIAVIGLLGIGVAPSGAATAGVAGDQPSQPLPPITLTEQQEASITAELDKFGVAPATRDELLDKLTEGGGWDNMTDAAPASVDIETIDGISYTISRFEDGSFIAAGIEQPAPADPKARAIQNCSSSGTSAGVSYRTNCTIIVTNGATSGQFKASYSLWSSGTSIYNVGNGTVNTDIGVATAGGFSSSTAPGTSRWTQFNWTTVIDGWYQASRYVRLSVTTSGASSSANY